MGFGWALRRKRQLLLCLVIATVIYLIRSIVNMTTSDAPLICETTPEMRLKMSDLLNRINQALDSLDITYFLCYNSLWGALRVKGPLKWHSSLEVCLLNEDLVNVEEAFLIRTFKRHQLTVTYRSSDGTYLIDAADEESPSAQLIIFEENAFTNQYRRVGWKNRLLPADSCDQLHCFPARLVAKPLPTAKFFTFDMPVPREEVEIQKYLFPNSWWTDLEPKQCREE